MSLFGSKVVARTLLVFCVFDGKGETYSPPFLGDSDEDARRAFVDAISSKQGLVGMHPEDHSLMRVGSYDKYSGLIVGLPAPVLVVTGVTLMGGIQRPALEVAS